MLTLTELKRDVESGSIDTVVVAFSGMQGRLLGKRVHAPYFVEENIADHGVEGCNYLLALDMEMDPIPGVLDRELGAGVGDFAIGPISTSLRRIPWLEEKGTGSATSKWVNSSRSGRRRGRCFKSGRARA